MLYIVFLSFLFSVLVGYLSTKKESIIEVFKRDIF